MYLIKTHIQDSPIADKGLFTQELIIKGQIVWKFVQGHDQIVPLESFEKLDQVAQKHIEKVGYISPTTHRWVIPPPGDRAEFTNHSRTNNLSVAIDKEISEEPYFVANRDIPAGEELTVNYLEFDVRTISDPPVWISTQA